MRQITESCCLCLPFSDCKLLGLRTGCTGISFKQLQYDRNIFLSYFLVRSQGLEPIRLKFLQTDPEHVLPWPVLLMGEPVKLLYLVDPLSLKQIVTEGPCFGIGLMLFGFIVNR